MCRELLATWCVRCMYRDIICCLKGQVYVQRLDWFSDRSYVCKETILTAWQVDCIYRDFIGSLTGRSNVCTETIRSLTGQVYVQRLYCCDEMNRYVRPLQNRFIRKLLEI